MTKRQTWVRISIEMEPGAWLEIDVKEKDVADHLKEDFKVFSPLTHQYTIEAAHRADLRDGQ